ncbi:hypothetical protein HY091_01660 [Candidatus Kaiserbacteria bacterium]|nr:hypothetical protein [Candidatus Kaiserbacteria bacterium]
MPKWTVVLTEDREHEGGIARIIVFPYPPKEYNGGPVARMTKIPVDVEYFEAIWKLFGNDDLARELNAIAKKSFELGRGYERRRAQKKLKERLAPHAHC